MLRVLGTIRAPFLILTPACLLLALAVANHCCAPINLLLFAVVLIAALAAQISVNAFNEYFDFHSGLDAQTQRTPFSGGSGTLVSNPELAPLTLSIAVTSLFIVIACGSYFIWLRGLQLLLPIGITGVLLITLYTTWVVRHPLLCLLAAGSGFGPIMLTGSVIALTGQLPTIALWATLPIFFVVNNLLLLNQLPDIDADRQVGRRTLPVVAGIQRSIQTYALFSLLAIASLSGGIVFGPLPTLAALALIPLLATFPVIRGIQRHATNRTAILPLLAINVGISITTPILMAVGIWLA